MSRLRRALGVFLTSVRELSGESAYERAVGQAQREGEPAPSRQEFWLSDLERRYGPGVRRCC